MASPTGAKPLWGSITSPELTFNGKTPTSLLSVDALVNENLYNQESFDSTDLHSKVNFNEQMQQWGFQLLQTTDYDTTRTSELFPTALRGSAMGFAYNSGRVVSAAAPYLIGSISEHAGLSYALCITSAAFLLVALIATALRQPAVTNAV